MEATRRNSTAAAKTSSIRTSSISQEIHPSSPKLGERSLSRIGLKNNEENQNIRTQSRSSPASRKEITKKPEVPSFGKILRRMASSPASYVHHRTSGESSARILPNSHPPAMQVVRYAKVKSFSRPVSAWALSPGRSTPPHAGRMTPPVQLTSSLESASSDGTIQRAGKFSSVLGLFRPRKASSGQEDSMQQLRILQTRLIQWRFANTRAEAVMRARVLAAENQTQKTWLRISHLRNSVTEKKMEVQRLRDEIKLNKVLNSQIGHLHEWERMEKKNLEAVAKTSRLLEATVVRMPLVRGAKGTVGSILGALYAAMDVMEKIEATVSRFFIKTCLMGSAIAELVKIMIQERTRLNELMNLTCTMASLEAQECSLRAHLIQVSGRTNN